MKMKLSKRIAAASLAALLALSTASCQGPGVNVPGGQTGSEDFQKNMHQSGFPGLAQMCETDVGIYFQKDTYLYYVDKETKKATVLCARPDCGHDGTDCSAWLNTMGMWFTGGKLYCVAFTGKKEVLSLKPDGTGRRAAGELRFSLGASPSSYTRPIYHRGYMYYVYNDVLYRVPLGGKSDDAKAIWEAPEGDGGRSGDDLKLTLWADGDSVYFMANIEKPGGSCVDTLFAYDTVGGLVAEVWATPGETEVGTWDRTGVSPSQWYVLDGSIYFFLAGNGLWRTELETGRHEKLADTTEKVPYGSAVFSDDCMCLIRDATHGDNTGGEAFFVYGLDGSFKKELPLDALYAEMGGAADCVPLFITGGCIYFAVESARTEPQEWRLCCADIDTGEITQIYTWH